MSDVPKMEARDPTFRNYTADAAASYKARRGIYPAKLIEMVIDRHVSTGGGTDLLLDVGCGPGSATFLVGPSFKRVIGADPGEGMIQTARSISYGGDNALEFRVCSAEDIDSLAEPETVDLITAATAAHWFHMKEFYVAASKVLKPGGSIILWCSAKGFCDLKTTPNAAKVQVLFLEFHLESLRPYELPGNTQARELYANLDMPWNITTTDADTKAALEVFDKDSSSRETFNENGVPDERFEHGYLSWRTVTVEQLRMVLGTVSPVTRWREAHKEQLERGQVEDCVDKVIRQMKELMSEIPGGENKESVDGCSEMVMVVIKKKKKSNTS